MYYAIIAAIVIIIVWLVIKALSSNHVKWLAEQSPVGCWECKNVDHNIILQFNGEEGKHGGSYHKITEHDSNRYREFGHWFSQMVEINMLVMASEQPEEYPIGKDFKNNIWYTGPEQITIVETDNRYVFKKASEEARQKIEEMIDALAAEGEESD